MPCAFVRIYVDVSPRMKSSEPYPGWELLCYIFLGILAGRVLSMTIPLTGSSAGQVIQAQQILEDSTQAEHGASRKWHRWMGGVENENLPSPNNAPIMQGKIHTVQMQGWLWKRKAKTAGASRGHDDSRRGRGCRGRW